MTVRAIVAPAVALRLVLGLVLVLVLALASASGCGSESKTGALSIELAPSPDPAAGMGCPDTVSAPLPEPEEAKCVHVSICEQVSESTCNSVPLLRPEEDHATPGGFVLSFLVGADRQLRFDAQLRDGARYKVRVELYQDPAEHPEGAQAIAAGEADGVAFGGGGPVRVRLYPFERWSCAGPRTAGGTETQPLGRALHEAVRLPNGDVLIFGGVVASRVPAVGFVEGALLQREVEVYATAEDRFYPVSVTTPEPRGGVGRVFFAAALLPSAAGATTYRIRVLGGFRLDDDAVAARFDASQAGSFHGTPILPGERAVPADPVDLVYDATTRALRVEVASGAGISPAGFNAVTDFGETTSPRAALLLGVTSNGSMVDPPRPQIDPLAVSWVDSSGTIGAPAMLSAGRFGATITRLERDRDVALVWGGNVEEATGDETASHAGDMFEEDRSVTAVAGGVVTGIDTGLPPSVVFHTATRIEDDVVLLAGGLEVGSEMIEGMGVTTRVASRPLAVLTWAGDGPRFTATYPALPAEVTATIFHTATVVPVAGVEDGVLIAGGAGRQGTQTLFPQQLTGTVQRAPGGYEYAPGPSLIEGRWGHTATLLGNGRVLVVGGFGRTGAELRSLTAAELLVRSTPPAAIRMCGDETMDAGTRADSGPADAGARTDGGVADDAAAVDGAAPDGAPPAP